VNTFRKRAPPETLAALRIVRERGVEAVSSEALAELRRFRYVGTAGAVTVRGASMLAAAEEFKKNCKVCSKPFSSRWERQEYCGKACKANAHRDRQEGLSDAGKQSTFTVASGSNVRILAVHVSTETLARRAAESDLHLFALLHRVLYVAKEKDAWSRG
jgi:hypothetical protein